MLSNDSLDTYFKGYGHDAVRPPRTAVGLLRGLERSGKTFTRLRLRVSARQIWIHWLLVLSLVAAAMPLAATSNRSRSTFRFVDAETGAAIQPASVLIGGHQVAPSVGDDGVVIVEMDADERMVEVHAPGYPVMRAEHTAVAPVSAIYTFEMLAERRPKSVIVTVDDATYSVTGWVRDDDDRKPIQAARVVFDSACARIQVFTGFDGSFSFVVSEVAFESEWRLYAEAPGWQRRELTGRGNVEVPRAFVHNFLLFPDKTSATALSRRVAVLPPGTDAYPRAALLSQALPNSIRVGVGAARQSNAGCTGMNDACTKSFNNCPNVDVVSTELYVKRVLRGELFGTPIWDNAQLQYFKAQAVANRTYASSHALNDNRGTQYDLCNSAFCQCYFSGLTSFGSITTAASDETAGEVLVKSNGQIGYSEYGAWNGTCARGWMHGDSAGARTNCSFDAAFSISQPLFDQAIYDNWNCSCRSTNPSNWGHSRGMSQYGGHFRAVGGDTYEEILDFYYAAYGLQLSSSSGGNPTPTLITRQVAPLSVEVNQSFSINTTMRVDDATAEHAGISVSFPSLTATGVSGTSYNSSQGSVSTSSASSGALQIYKDNYPLHLLAEADWSNVSAGSTKNFNLTVTPKQSGSFKVRIRAWATTNGYNNAWRDPSSGTLDQQNYPVHEYTVNVSNTMTRIIRLDGDLAFGDVSVGETATRTLIIYNDGNATLNVSGITYPSGFSGGWSGSIAAGASKSVSVTFAPTSTTNYSGTITVSSDKTSGTNTIACSGRGVSSVTRIIRLAGDLSFGTVTVGQTGTRQLTIHNDGNATLTVSSINYPSGFTGDWSSGTIGAGNSRVVNVTFAPTAGTTYSGTITVNSDKTNGANTISCSGAGTVASQAVYDSVLKVPKCATVGSTCDSGSLLMGRAGLGPEPNAPNTIANSCSDGASGVYLSDESNERLSISSTDGTPFAPGKAVRIEATVWAYDSSDVLDIYYTADVQNPNWLWIATFGIGGSGSQTLATIYTIPTGSALHAVRANFRYQGSPASCTSGPYDDHDDLVFAINSAPPVVGGSKPHADFDGDFRSDLLWYHATSGETYLWTMNSFTPLTRGSVNYTADLNWKIAGIGDFNGDGKADVVWRHALSGENYIWLMYGATIISAGTINWTTDPNWKIVGVADHNGDGKADILWRHTQTGNNYIYLMNGLTITTGADLRQVPDIGWKIVGSGDLNGDGKADIVWRHGTTGQTYAWLMNGITLAGEGLIETIADQNWTVAAVRDFDGDGKADLFWRNDATGENYLYRMNSIAAIARGYINVVADLSWKVAAVADYNGDGKADIAWRHALNGNNYVYLMNGFAITTSTDLPPVTDTRWSIVR